MLGLKIYVVHKRLNTKISRMIKRNEHNQYLQSGYGTHPIKHLEELKIK